MRDFAALAAIEAWVLAHEADLADPSYEGDEASPEQWASLEVVLNAAGVSADWLRARSTQDSATLSGEPADAAAVLLSGAVGTCFGKMPALRMLMAADRLIWSKVGWAAFSAAVATEVGSDRPKQVALAKCLEELVHAFTWAPRRIVDAHRDNMCALVERYRVQSQLDDLWSGGPSMIMLVKHKPAFDALRLSDSGLYLRLLDAFPHPEPARHILGYAAHRMDLDGLLMLLALARPCFEGGDWLPSVKAPVLVLAAIEEKLATTTDPNKDGASAPLNAFAAATRKAVRGVLERTDGNELGHAWLQQLIQRRTFVNRRRSEDDLLRLEQHGRLLLELASALAPRCYAVDWVRAERETWRRNRAVAAIAAAGLGETGSHDTAVALIEDVLRLGLWTTAQEDGFSAQSSSERQLMAAVIGRHDASASWFDELWRDLAPTRDRARHATTSAGGHAGDATVIAVTWFLFGLDAVDVHNPAHRALWRSLHSAVQEGAMAQTSHLAQPAWRARYRFLAAYLAHRLVTVGDEEAMHDLRDFVGPLLYLDMTLAEVVTVLFDAGVEPTVIAAGTEQPAFLVELLRRLETEQAWREARQKKQLGAQSQFSQVIARIADTIGGVALIPL